MKFTQKHKIGASVVAIIFCVAGYVFYTNYNTPENRLSRACETLLIKRLKAPSGYKAINFTFSKNSMDADDYISYAEQHRPKPLDQWVKDYLKQTKQQPIAYGLDMEYDAPNGFGAVIRNNAYCEYVTEFGDEGPSGTLSVYLDGESQSSYLLNQIKAMSNQAPELQRSARDYRIARQTQPSTKP